MAQANHHIYIRHGKHGAKTLKKKLTLFDKIIMTVSLIYPLSALPQAFQVMSGDAEGVSLLSWSTFWAASILFFVYGVMHRVAPMIITYAMWFFIDGIIVIGILVQSS